MFRQFYRAVVLSGVLCIALAGYTQVYAACTGFCSEGPPILCTAGLIVTCPYPSTSCICYGFGTCACGWSTWWASCQCM